MPVPATITTTQAASSIKSLYKEAFSLNPSTIICLYILDLREILSDNNLQNKFPNGRFLFHNNVKFLNTSIFWDVDKTGQVSEFIGCPITVEGFEFSSRGVVATPKLSITVSDQGIDTLSLLRQEIFAIGDIIGAGLTRIKTFAKFLPTENKLDQVMSDEWEPDSYAEFVRDIYFVERLENADKTSIVYSLSSILDLENLQLPSRRVQANSCSWQYRSRGCLYEYEANREPSIHGKSPNSNSAEPFPVSILPKAAPPVANDKDELIFGDSTNSILGIPEGASHGLWKFNQTYIIGDFVFIKKNLVNYYFVCKRVNTNLSPPNNDYWIEEACGKSVHSCKLRWGTAGAVDVGSTSLKKGELPYGGFISVSRLNNR